MMIVRLSGHPLVRDSLTYFKSMHMKQGSKGMENHWSLIQTACNKWHGIVEEVAARPESSTSVEDQVWHAVYVAAFSPCACSFALRAPWGVPWCVLWAA